MKTHIQIISLLIGFIFSFSVHALTLGNPAEGVPNRQWDAKESEEFKLRIWFQKDSAVEERIASLIFAFMQNEIIPSEEALIGRRHQSDDGRGPNGGDGKLDIYLFDFPPPPPGEEMNDAATVGYSEDRTPNMGCPGRPSYIMVNLRWAKKASMDALASIMAHEYFHVLQNTFDMLGNCDFYTGVTEGTAEYVMHHVYPNSNEEHDWYLFSEDGSLSMLTEDYSTWPFYMYMTKKLGDKSLLTLLTNFASYNAFDALDRTLPGGFKKHWVEYATLQWNQSPLNDSFLQWDNYSAVPGRGSRQSDGHLASITPEKVILDANGQYRFEMNMKLPPMTREIYAFDVSNEDIRSIAINNPIRENIGKMNVKLLGRKKGSSNFEEIFWEDHDRKDYLYCLDKKDEAFDLIVLVAANYQHHRNDETITATPHFRATNQGCYGFKGTVKFSMQYPNNSLVIKGEINDFEVREKGRTTDSNNKNQFAVVGGRGIYRATGKLGNCEANFAGTLELKTGPRTIGLMLESYSVAPAPWGVYHINVFLTRDTIPVTCSGPNGPITANFPIGLSTMIGAPTSPPNHGGKPDLQGQISNYASTMSWDLRPIKE
ncbi:MAG: hypothetical protein HYV97_01385 [Bdellovibrio sp.]|nr:hypothetical protein [Bdellovibrio sp.]